MFRLNITRECHFASASVVLDDGRACATVDFAVLPHDTFLKVSYFFLKIGQIILFWYFYTFFYTFFCSRTFLILFFPKSVISYFFCCKNLSLETHQSPLANQDLRRFIRSQNLSAFLSSLSLFLHLLFHRIGQPRKLDIEEETLFWFWIFGQLSMICRICDSSELVGSQRWMWFENCSSFSQIICAMPYDGLEWPTFCKDLLTKDNDQMILHGSWFYQVVGFHS